jgi:hypothetical protein
MFSVIVRCCEAMRSSSCWPISDASSASRSSAAQIRAANISTFLSSSINCSAVGAHTASTPQSRLALRIGNRITRSCGARREAMGSSATGGKSAAR